MHDHQKQPPANHQYCCQAPISAANLTGTSTATPMVVAIAASITLGHHLEPPLC